MVSYYLVRHADAELSSHEAGLTALGRQQAVGLGRRLAGVSFDAAWRSDMARAARTAEILARGRTDIAWLVSPKLREVDFSSAPALDAKPEGYRAWEVVALARMETETRGWLMENPWQWLGPCRTGLIDEVGSKGLVSFRTDVADRATRRLKPAATDSSLITHHSPEPRVLVVAHGGPIRLLICLLLGIPAEHHWAFRVGHGSLTVVERGADMGTLVLLNDRCHLAGIAANPMEAHHGR